MTASSSSSNLLNPGIAAGTKKHHHLSLTAAEDGIKLLRCQLERIRQSEMTRFTEMGIGLTMNYPGLYGPPLSASGSEFGGGLASQGSLGMTLPGGRVFGSGTLSSRGRAPKAGSWAKGKRSNLDSTGTMTTAGGGGGGGGVLSGEDGGHDKSGKSSANTSSELQPFTRFEATLYSDLEHKYGGGQGGF